VLEEDAEYEKRRIDPYSNFDPILYIKFREQPILKSAIEFAREGKIGAVSSLLSRYPGELNQVIDFDLHRAPGMSNSKHRGATEGVLKLKKDCLWAENRKFVVLVFSHTFLVRFLREIFKKYIQLYAYVRFST